MVADIFPKIEDWRKHLLDTSKRNRLINFKSGGSGGVDLVHPDAAELWLKLIVDEAALTFPWKRDLVDLPPEEIDFDPAAQRAEAEETGQAPAFQSARPDVLAMCLASSLLKPTHLITTLSDKQMSARLKRLELNARESESELGMNTLFVAFGFLRWFESEDSKTPISSPLLLLPVRLERSTIESPWVIRAEEDEARRNDTLAELMKSDHRVVLPQLDELCDDSDDSSDLFEKYAQEVKALVKHHRRWEVRTDAAALGIFHFQKLAMWEDLGKNAERIAGHPLCRAIAGDREAVPATPNDLPQAEVLDDVVPPQDVVHILDADSSQQAAMEAVKRGANLVLDGPPGTGKSQTIANLIAEYLAVGKTILFVSEKTAALDVVKRRLDECRLGDFCLELHSHKANKREVVTELGRCLNLPPESHQDPAEQLRELAEARSRLNSYVRVLHRRREPLGMSIFQAHGELARAERLTSKTRCPILDPTQADGTRLRRITDILRSLPDCLDVIERRDRHPWRGCKLSVRSLSLQDDMTYHLDRLARLFPEAVDMAKELARFGLSDDHPTRGEWLSATEDARLILKGPLVPSIWFEGDPRSIAAAVIELNKVSHEIRILVDRTPEFSQSAVRAVEAEKLPQPPESSDLDEVGVMGIRELGVRQSSQRLRDAQELMLEVSRRSEDSASAASRIGEIMGINTLKLESRQLPKLAEVGRLLLKAGKVPSGWWDDAVRGELIAVADQATSQAKEAGKLRQELLRAFVPVVVDDPSRPTFSDLPTSRSEEDAHPEERMDVILDRLIQRRRDLTRLVDEAAGVAATERALAGLLGSPVSEATIGQIKAFSAAADRIVRLAPINANLWGRESRENSRIALAEVGRLTSLAEATTEALADRIAADALTGALDSIVAEALAYRGWSRWVRPGWWRIKGRLRAVFPTGLPPRDQLVADLGRLVERRRSLDQIVALTDSYRDSWLFEADGKPDRSKSEEVIARAEEAEQLHPATLKLREAMGEAGASLREGVTAQAGALRQAIEAIEATFRRLLESMPSFPGYSLPPELACCRLDDLRAWTDEQVKQASRHIANLDALRTAMVPSAYSDATLENAQGWIAKLREYSDRAEYVRGIRQVYGERLGLTNSNDEFDRTEFAADRLKCVDALAKAVKLPAGFKRSMEPDGDLDRLQLENGLSTLAETLGGLGASWKQLRTVWGDGEWDDVRSGLPRCSATRLCEELGRRVVMVDLAAAFAERIAPLLKDGVELAWAALPNRLESLRGLIDLRTRLDGLRAPAKIERPMEELEARDWTEMSRLAETLIEFLDGWHRPIERAVAIGLSDQSARNALQTLVSRTDSILKDGLAESWRYLTSSLFDSDADVSTGITLDTATMEVLAGWMRDRAGDVPASQDWIRYREMEKEAIAAGVESVIDEVKRGEVRAEEAAVAYRTRFLRHWLDAVYEQTPELRRFATDVHERLTSRYADLDRLAVETAPERIRGALLARFDRPTLVTDVPPKSSELGLLVGQVDKKRGHLPLRKLFHKIPTVLPRLKPCLMMSPLAVSTYLQSPELLFDLVIFDEASQVRPHDAVSAIYRGRQLVVAGDQKQLPPSNFFDKSAEGDVDEEGEQLSDYESVLDVCCSLGLPRRRLRWHYRSRREGLIAFSNRFYYSGDLVTFPSIRDAGGSAIQFEYVQSGLYSDGVNTVEARRVAELVIEHLLATPEASLGVIAFSKRQQLRILDELEALRRKHPGLEEYFRGGRPEPFFAKNLENVQGDERDVMILGVGYGPDEVGKVAMKFGPLNRQGGERRLNVAVTRARERMILVSSLHAGDLDLSKTGAEGVRLLRAYLDYAENGTDALARALTESDQREFDSPFEREVAEELERHGLLVHKQVGCGGFRIDMAVVDDRQPGRYLLGVECDGATYHSSATARDRDRLRQEVLEALGWRLCRVWSTDWMRDRADQVKRVLAAVERARNESPEPRKTTTFRSETIRVAPQTVPPPRGSRGSIVYKSIAEVPDTEIRKAVTEVLTIAGGTQPNDLTKAVRRRLGFERTGKNIEARVGAVIEDMIRTGRLATSRDDGSVRVAPAKTSS